MKISLLFFGLFLLSLLKSAPAQDLPDKIRGYKVYDAAIRVETPKTVTDGKTDGKRATITISEPELVDAGLTGVTLEVAAGVAAVDQSFRVDFLTFHDFRINGIAVEIEEYKHSFEIKRNTPVDLPYPLRIFLSTVSLARAANNELRAPKKEWPVTGTVFVFGRFKKFGFSFKRVVPVRIDLVIKAPSAIASNTDDN